MAEANEDWSRIPDLARALGLAERTLYTKARSGEFETRRIDGVLHIRRNQGVLLKERERLRTAELVPIRSGASDDALARKEPLDPELAVRKRLAHQTHLIRQQRAAEMERAEVEREAERLAEEERERKFAERLQMRQLEIEVAQREWALEQERRQALARAENERLAEIEKREQRIRAAHETKRRAAWEQDLLGRMTTWLSGHLGAQYIRRGLDVCRQALASFTPDDSISLVETLLQAEVSSQFAAELAEKREREQAQSRTQHLEHLIRRETAWLSRSDASVVEEALRKAARLAAPEVYDVAMEEAARAARRGVQDRVAQLRAAERQAEASEYDRQRAEHEARSQRRNAEHEQQVRKWREEDKQRADEAAWNRARQRLSADVSRSLPYGATAQERDAAVAAATGRLGELAGQCSVDEAVREVDALIQVHRASVARRIDSERRAADRSRAVNRWLGYLPRNVPLAERDELEGVLVAAYDRCDTWNFEQQAEKIIADYRK